MMMRQAYQKTAIWMVAIFLVGMGTGFFGCDGNGGEAIGGPERIIETFLIQENTFFLRTDLDPDITVSDGATIYRLQSQGRVTFKMVGTDSSRTLLLESQDLIIERPGALLITVLMEF